MPSQPGPAAAAGRDYLRVLSRRKVFLVLVATAVVIATQGGAAIRPPRYRATAEVALPADARGPLRLAFARFLEDKGVVDGARAAGAEPGAAVVGSAEGGVLYVRATSTKAIGAANTATAFARALVKRAAVAANAGAKPGRSQADLERGIPTLKATASVPTAPSDPRPLPTLAWSLPLALVAGVAGASLVEVGDRWFGRGEAGMSTGPLRF